MPFTPLMTLDPERLRITAQTLCDVFDIPSLHPHQEETGQNILKGISTLLDVPTGGGKTLAFWYALFYHWSPGNTHEECQKIVLVIGPLVALLESQAKTLNGKGIPAVAITKTSKNITQALTDLGNNKYRVGLLGPEMALGNEFHELVANNVCFANNIICLVIDEAHCICEWGTDDFRPDYREIVKMVARVPSGLPILTATATAPRDVISNIMHYLGLPPDCARVQVSNEKLNIALSVRILQNEPDSYADLLTLFGEDMLDPKDFPQTLLYANERQVVEKIQDVLRRLKPEGWDPEIFEFYHLHIDEARKKLLQERISSGFLRAAASTDALGLGMDFPAILRVILYGKPRTFLSLVQKLGRCVRDHSLRGEGVLYITKAMYTRACIELDILNEAEASDQSDNSDEDDINIDVAEGVQADRDAAVAREDASDEEEEGSPPPKRRKYAKKTKKKLSRMEARDRRYLLEYMTTTKCRRIPWNKFFGNKYKRRLDHPFPDGPCCDNCNPELFQVETIVLTGGHQLKTGRRGKSSPELETAVRSRLNELRDQLMAHDYPNQHFLTGSAILADDVVDVLAQRARSITSAETILQHTRWRFAPKYGDAVAEAIQDVLLDFPDLAKAAREEAAAERTQKTLDAVELKELRSRLLLVFDGCHAAVISEYKNVAAGPKKNRRIERRQVCKPFMAVPRIDHFPDYHEVILEPISIKQIHTFSHRPTHYLSILEYREAWHLLFANARQYNEPGSEIVQDADWLQKVFDDKLYMLSTIYELPGYETLSGDIPSRAASSGPPSPTRDITTISLLVD